MELKEHLNRQSGAKVGVYTYTRRAETEIKAQFEKLGLRKFFKRTFGHVQALRPDLLQLKGVPEDDSVVSEIGFESTMLSHQGNKASFTSP